MIDIETVIDFLRTKNCSIYEDGEPLIKKKLKIKCNECGNIFIRNYSSIKEHKSDVICPKCYKNYKYKKIAKIGNRLIDCNFDIEKYIVNKDDLYKLLKTSIKEVETVCDKCGNVSIKTPHSLSTSGFICNSCYDKNSISEKFLSFIFLSIGIDSNREYFINGNQNYRYDFYVKNLNLLIELNGEHHYYESDFFIPRCGKSQIDIDLEKKNIAIENNYSYISIPIINSNFEYIKKQFIDYLPKSITNMFTDSVVENAWRDAKDGYIILCSNLYKIGFDVGEISTRLNISRSTVNRCLNKAEVLKLIKYKKNKKEVTQFSLDGNFISVYESCHEADRITGVSYKNISACCLGKRKTSGGFIWGYNNG